MLSQVAPPRCNDGRVGGILRSVTTAARPTGGWLFCALHSGVGLALCWGAHRPVSGGIDAWGPGAEVS